MFHATLHPLLNVASLEHFGEKSWTFISQHTPEVLNLTDSFYNLQPIRARALLHWVTWNRKVSA